MRTSLIYSADDGGWYAEVWATSSGSVLYTSPVYPLRHDAEADALRWRRGDAVRVVLP